MTVEEIDPEIMTPLVRIGEQIHASRRYTREQIASFAEISGDSNPLHHDRLAAERANFGEVIASGQQTASLMMGLVASHFSRADDGLVREMLCLNFNFAFKAPVFAEQDVEFDWRVSTVERNDSLGGFIAHLDGTASVAGHPCVVARGTLLVRRPATRAY
jgi:acyl dehydratase